MLRYVFETQEIVNIFHSKSHTIVFSYYLYVIKRTKNSHES